MKIVTFKYIKVTEIIFLKQLLHSSIMNLSLESNNRGRFVRKLCMIVGYTFELVISVLF